MKIYQSIRPLVKYFVLCLVLAIASTSLLAQTEQQVKTELDKRGISTLEQIQAELSKRGMSEDDARRQAKIYGLDYDDYISKYITKQEISTTGSPAAIQSIAIDTVDYDAELVDNNAQVAPVIEIDTKGDGLPYFGYGIFNNNPFADREGLVGNIDPGYIIGPGDQIRIYLWGEAEFQFEGQVDINGNLFIPNVGQFFLAGAAYGDLKVRAKEYFSKFYSGLTTVPAKIFLDLSLTKLRPTRVVLMGESNQPGSHLINAFATTLNSLFISGGINTNGSLRDIRLFRNNKLISSVDIYNYLIKGTVDEDTRLMSNDIIFIPRRLNSISLSGEVNIPGIFELKSDEGLLDLVGFAGGLKPTAYTQSIIIKRIRAVSERKNDVFDREIISLNYSELLEKGENFKLQDGDEIDFARVLDKFNNLITVSGSVFRPGDYEMQPDSKVKDLIIKAGGIRPNTYLNKIDLYRKDQNGDLKFRSFSLASILNDAASIDNIQLQADDSLKIYNEDELQSLKTVSIEGFVSEPKTILWRENLTMYDLIFMSANIEDLEYNNRVLTSRADLLRYNEGSNDWDVSPFNLDDVLDGRYNEILRPKDRLILYSKDITQTLDKYVYINGAVKNEGRFLLTDSMTVEDIIVQAGGFVIKSFRDTVSVSRENFDFSGNEIANVTRLSVDMSYLLGNSSKAEDNFYLKHNDKITVNYIPGSSDGREVFIEGEVKFPGSYFLKSKGEKLTELVKRAGGFSPNANIFGAKIYRNGQLLALDFEKLYKTGNDKFNVVLQDQDSIVFPESAFTVILEGGVINPSAHKYVQGMKAKTYLKNAGGKTKRGRKIYVTDPNGFTNRVKFLRNPRIKDGSIITVAEKPVKVKTEGQSFLNTFGSIMAITASTLTTIVLIQNIN